MNEAYAQNMGQLKEVFAAETKKAQKEHDEELQSLRSDMESAKNRAVEQMRDEKDGEIEKLKQEFEEKIKKVVKNADQQLQDKIREYEERLRQKDVEAQNLRDQHGKVEENSSA